MRTERDTIASPAQIPVADVQADKAQSSHKLSNENEVVASADEQHRQKVAAHIGQLFSQPWIKEVLGKLAQRQQKSLQNVAEHRQMNASSAAIWPIHAITMPPCIERAQGARLWDVDGNEYIDFHVGFGCQSLHGHNPEPVVQFVKDTLARGSTGNGYFSAFELEHTRLLKSLVPHREKFAFQNSGSDATAAAIRICRAATGRRLVVKFEGSINGQVDLVSYNSSPFYHGYPLMPFPPKNEEGVQLKSFLPGSQRLGGEDMLILSFNDPKSLEIIKKRKDEIACVLTEPVPLAFPFPDKAIPFIRELNDVCRKSNVLLVLDEVHSGFRYGPSGVTGFFNLDPDLVTYGKAISGLGMPLSAVAGRADLLEVVTTTGMSIMDYGRRMFMATTHINNHLSLAASYASLSLLKEKGQGFYDRTRQKVAHFKAGLARLCAQEGVSLQLLGYGDFMGMLSFVEDQEVNSVRELCVNVNPLATAVLLLMLRLRGVYFFSGPFFYLGDAHTQQDLDTLLTHVTDCVQEMKRNGFSFERPVF